MDSQTIVDAYQAKVSGQGLLWHDPDFILRKTSYQDTPDKEFNQQAVIHWWMNVYDPNGRGDDETPYEVYKTWNNALYKNFKYTRTNGYNTETNQACVHFAPYKEESLDDQEEELKLWLPHVKPSRCEEAEKEGKFVDLFEHTFSEHGSYYLWLFSDTELCLYKCTYGSIRCLQTFTSLSDMIEYVAKHHYYEKKYN